MATDVRQLVVLMLPLHLVVQILPATDSLLTVAVRIPLLPLLLVVLMLPLSRLT